MQRRQLTLALACAGNASDKQQEAPQTLTQSRRSSLIARESPYPYFWTLDGFHAEFRTLALAHAIPPKQATQALRSDAGKSNTHARPLSLSQTSNVWASVVQ